MKEKEFLELMEAFREHLEQHGKDGPDFNLTLTTARVLAEETVAPLGILKVRDDGGKAYEIKINLKK